MYNKLEEAVQVAQENADIDRSIYYVVRSGLTWFVTSERPPVPSIAIPPSPRHEQRPVQPGAGETLPCDCERKADDDN